MKKLQDDYALYIVKRNNGKDTIRLSSFHDVAGYARGMNPNLELTEVELIDQPMEVMNNPYMQERKIVWFSPIKPIYIEATMEDQRARDEYNSAVNIIAHIPDLTPLNLREGCTLMKLVANKEVYQVVEGAWRKVN